MSTVRVKGKALYPPQATSPARTRRGGAESGCDGLPGLRRDAPTTPPASDRSAPVPFGPRWKARCIFLTDRTSIQGCRLFAGDRTWIVRVLRVIGFGSNQQPPEPGET